MVDSLSKKLNAIGNTRINSRKPTSIENTNWDVVVKRANAIEDHFNSIITQTGFIKSARCNDFGYSPD